LRQSSELLRIDAGLLAHICLLYGDMHHDDDASAYASAATIVADEAGITPAEAFSAQAQIARWRHHYAEAADLAAQGFACSPLTSLRILLACQEANAAALAGDGRRARQALTQADTSPVHALDERSDSVWSCSPGRYALYRLSVALHCGDPTAALREADVGEAAWEPDQPSLLAAGHTYASQPAKRI
jgi:hypothetical protein